MEEFKDKYDEVISLDAGIYPLESIQLAACAFLDEAFFHIFPADGSGGRLKEINVAIKARVDGSADVERIHGKFTNELNRQSLRISLNRMNRKVRTQIVGRALASSLSSGEQGSSGKA